MVKVAGPATAVIVGAPPQLFTTFGAAAITTPAGSVSLKVSPVLAGDPAGFGIVKVSVEVCPTPMVAGAKALVSAGRLCAGGPGLVALVVILAVALMVAVVLLCVPPPAFAVTLR